MALKIGSEDKKKVIIAGALGAIVLILVIRTILSSFVGGSPPVPATPAPVATTVSIPATTRATARPASAGVSGHEAVKVESSMARLDPTLHPEWMTAAESLEYTGQGRNIFSMFSTAPVIEAVKGPIRPVAAEAAVAAGPPPPPPINLKFFGYVASKGEPRRAFLLHGDDVFIASEGDVVDHRYKVVTIAPFSMQVQDIPYHNTQTLPLVQN